jgi:hypothetical protein
MTMIAKSQPKAENIISVAETAYTGSLMEHDVVCEKGRGDHERLAGNMLYRFLINSNKESYNEKTPMERSQIIGKIISTIKDKEGWFVQHDESGKWARLTEEKVRKKVSDDLRREVRRRRERRSNSTVFSTKLKALKEKVKKQQESQDILHQVDDPRETDVLFGSGARRHVGNKNYWELMKQNLNHYIISPYGARSMISRSIVQGIRNRNGRFLEQDPKTSVWYEISDKRAIEKTSHALSNKKYKTKKRTTDDLPTPEESSESASACEVDSTSGNSSQENEDINESKAKTSSKKARLLQRMDEPPLDDIRNDRGVLLLASLNTLGTKVPPSPSTPPPSQQNNKNLITPVDERVLVSPNDSTRASSTSNNSVSDDSRDEYEERDSSIRRMSKGHPPVLDTAPHMGEYIYHKHASREVDIRMAPRYGRFINEDQYAREQMKYKSPPPSPYHHRPHHVYEYPPASYSSRYIDPASPRHPREVAEYHLPSPKGGTPRSPYHVMLPRRILKPPSYWDYEHASPRARHAEQNSSTRAN